MVAMLIKLLCIFPLFFVSGTATLFWNPFFHFQFRREPYNPFAPYTEPNDPSFSVREPDYPSTPVREPDNPSTPIREPINPSTPIREPYNPSTPIREPNNPSTPIREPSKPSTPVREPDNPSTPVREPDNPSTPIREPDNPSTPIREPNKPSTPIREPNKPSTPIGLPGAANNNTNNVVETAYKGKWELVSQNSGVSAMHAILLPKINKVLMYDATIWRISKIPLPPQKMPCHMVDPVNKVQDCWCHSVLFDIQTAQLQALKIETDTWCSSGGLTVDGNLVSTGGFQGGANTARYLSTCKDCDWKEYPKALADPRWYATQVTLPDGAFIVVGGREAFSYEFIPREGENNKKAVFFPFLKDTSDNLELPDKQIFKLENNLYPFVHLSTDGNLFIFANNRSILFDPAGNKVVREYPPLPGGARSYPATGMSTLLPIRLQVQNPSVIPAEVLVCGGAERDAYYKAETKKQFVPALRDCGRISLVDQNAAWKKEDMPSSRVMGDMTILPTGDVLMINGAKTGTSAWGDAEEPNLVPVLYKSDTKTGNRFQELAAGTIPRMYHSTSVLLPDGKVLIAGSNTNNGYRYDVKYPTELRVEKFSPPYLDPSLNTLRLEIVVDKSDKVLMYGKKFSVKVKSKELALNDLMVTMYAPAFTTHGISMNQRLLMLGVIEVVNNVWPGVHNILVAAPPSGKLAPPGYYLLYVLYKGVPSVAEWIQIK